MSEKEMLDLAAKFAPYRYVLFQALKLAVCAALLTSPRSLFMWYMWRVEEVDVTVMTG
jgi:DNA-3-methyladenine glycosylase II